MDVQSGESEEEEVMGEGIGESAMEELVPEWGRWRDSNQWSLSHSGKFVPEPTESRSAWISGERQPLKTYAHQFEYGRREWRGCLKSWSHHTTIMRASLSEPRESEIKLSHEDLTGILIWYANDVLPRNAWQNPECSSPGANAPAKCSGLLDQSSPNFCQKQKGHRRY